MAEIRMSLSEYTSNQSRCQGQLSNKKLLFDTEFGEK